MRSIVGGDIFRIARTVVMLLPSSALTCNLDRICWRNEAASMGLEMARGRDTNLSKTWSGRSEINRSLLLFAAMASSTLRYNIASGL